MMWKIVDVVQEEGKLKCEIQKFAIACYFPELHAILSFFTMRPISED